VNSGPTCVLVDDFNGDSQADVAVGYEGGSVVSILLGRGDGTFNPKTDYATWEIPWHLATGDFNYDGKPDLVAANYDWQRITVLMNSGNGTFALPVTHPVANEPVTVAVGDFNGDNLSDIASANYASISVLLGFGDGTFSTATNYFLGGKHAAVGDFNKDGMPDLVLDLGGKVGIFWNETIPRLHIQAVSTGVRIAWPAWKGYELEAATSLASGSSWSPVNTTPAVLGSQNVITNPVSSGNQVFRLRRR